VDSDGGSTFKSAGNAQQRNSILLALKNSYKLRLEKRMLRFRWNYAKAFNPNSSQVTVLGVNDETLGVIGNPGYVLMRLKTPYNCNKKVKYYTENHTFKAGGILLEAITIIWRWNQ
jgi:hypothetical protein